MGDLQMILQAFFQVFTGTNLLMILIGLVIGMIVGCIPGLSVMLGIILMLPITYSIHDPATAIILLLAVYVGGMYGGGSRSRISPKLYCSPTSPGATLTL